MDTATKEIIFFGLIFIWAYYTHPAVVNPQQPSMPPAMDIYQGWEDKRYDVVTDHILAAATKKKLCSNRGYRASLPNIPHHGKVSLWRNIVGQQLSSIHRVS